ncbi:hypothetical protein [Stutzerimonas chloritidismutans]|uniref:hypothetical protein n=1 Tax=Stutzerimonas chloritidismutans TaxID=203192 RepID=UPI003F170B0A
MNPSERGKQNLETLEDRIPARDDQARSNGRTSNGEAAGGDRDDVPGGAYNVPSDMTEEVSDDPARGSDKPRH